MSFPRRQQARRLRRAAASGAAAIVAGTLAATIASVGATALAGLLALVMAALVLDARRWVRLAARSRVGARSEDAVHRALGGLEAEGWRLRHSLPWGGRGDIDSVAIAPTGIAFAIESKTRAFDERHLAHARHTRVLAQKSTMPGRDGRRCLQIPRLVGAVSERARNQIAAPSRRGSVP